MKLIKCCVQLKSFDVDVIIRAYKELREAAEKNTFLQISHLISLPTHIKKITVNRSPHIDKKSREQFEIRTFSRVVEITSSKNDKRFADDFIKMLQSTVFFGLHIKVVFTYSDMIIL
jgi:small subunit ribosomal protein S10